MVRGGKAERDQGRGGGRESEKGTRREEEEDVFL